MKVKYKENLQLPDPLLILICHLIRWIDSGDPSRMPFKCTSRMPMNWQESWLWSLACVFFLTMPSQLFLNEHWVLTKPMRASFTFISIYLFSTWLEISRGEELRALRTPAMEAGSEEIEKFLDYIWKKCDLYLWLLVLIQADPSDAQSSFRYDPLCLTTCNPYIFV